MNLPNKITLSRILLMPAVIVIFLIDFDLNYFVAGLVFSLLCCTDFIDGALARKRGEVTTLGKFLDPLADKVAVAIGLFLLVYAGLFSYKDFHTTTFNIIGLVCSILIIIRELMIGLFRQVAISKGVSMSADMLGKVKTVITDFSIPVLFVSRYHIAIYVIGISLFYIAFVMTMISLIHYVIKYRDLFANSEENI